MSVKANFAGVQVKISVSTALKYALEFLEEDLIVLGRAEHVGNVIEEVVAVDEVVKAFFHLEAEALGRIDVPMGW